MRKVFILISTMFALVGCVQDKDMYSPLTPENGKNFSLSDKISVKSSLPDGTLCLLFTSDPYIDGDLVGEPVMRAYAPFENSIKIPKSVDKLYAYVNGVVKEYQRGDLNIGDAPVTTGASMTRADDTKPTIVGEYDWVALTPPFITAIYQFYPEGQGNVTAEQRTVSTDLVAIKGVKETYVHPGTGAITTSEWGNTKVWITYVGNGGSGFSGDLWYYTYEVDENKNPITPLKDLVYKPIFNQADPNKISPADGPGKRFYLGEFEPGLRIGFKFLGNAKLGNDPYPKHSTPFYNNEAYGKLDTKNNATCGVIRLWNYDNVKYATLGMENRLPSESSWDNDYNDMICLLEATPLVVENTVYPPIPEPEIIKWQGYWLFEDNYPNEGDYDFNDVVIRYAITEIKDKPTIVDLQFLAKGATFVNSFGVNGVIRYENLTGFANVYANEDIADQPVKQFTMAKADSYIPMLSNGTSSFNLLTFNPITYDFPNVLEIPIADDFKFQWCLETTRIDDAYPKYNFWVQSGCTVDTDWYKATPVANTTWTK